MEKNTVCLDLVRYERLIEMEKNYHEQKVMVSTYIGCGEYETVVYLGAEQAIYDLSKRTKELELQYKKELQDEKDYARKHIDKSKDLQINLNLAKQMSILEFIKWRKSK